VSKKNNKNDSFAYTVESCHVWHSRLGYANYRSLQRMVNLGLLPSFNIENGHKCEVCVESKFTRKSFPSVERNSELLDLIHSDVCDMKSTPTRGEKNYFVTFIDNCSKYCYVYLLRSKDETFDMFKMFKAEVENQLGKEIKMLRSYRGSEYESLALSEFCESYGIIHQMIAPYTSQQNGIAEKKNRTLKDMINCMLNSLGLPHNLWGKHCLLQILY